MALWLYGTMALWLHGGICTPIYVYSFGVVGFVLVDTESGTHLLPVCRRSTLMMLFSSSFSLFMQSCVSRLVYQALHYIISVFKINMWQWQPLPAVGHAAGAAFWLNCHMEFCGQHFVWRIVIELVPSYPCLCPNMCLHFPEQPHKKLEEHRERETPTDPCAKYKWICSVEARRVFGAIQNGPLPFGPCLLLLHLTRQGSHQKFHIHNLIKLTFCWIMYLHDCGTKYGLGTACHVYAPRIYIFLCPQASRSITLVLNCLRVAVLWRIMCIFGVGWVQQTRKPI